MRIILDPALSGATNMGRDEALLTSAAGSGPATLRFYQWAAATISLGYFQPIAAWEAQDDRLRSLGLVRRPTGGGAILHDRELTYSLAVRTDLQTLAGQALRLYGLAHAAIRDALNELGVPARFFDGQPEGNAQRGPFFCFARRHACDLLVGPDKIVGSAQRRRPGAILQHGSIILNRTGPQPCIGVNDRRGEPIGPADLAALLVGHFRRVLGVELEPGAMTEAEEHAADDAARKYAGRLWTRLR